MNHLINKMSGFIFGRSVSKAVRFFWSDNKGTFMLMAAVVISLTAAGCNISGSEMASGPKDADTIHSTQGSISAIIGPSDTCPVITGEDIAGAVAPMSHPDAHPHVFNIQLLKAEGLLLPAVQKVQGHLQLKACRTLDETYLLQWSLHINNKEGLGYTGWSLVDPDTEEELFGTIFSSKVASDRLVQQSGIMEVEGDFIVGPPDLRAVVTTTDPSQILIGLLLPAVQAKN